MNKACLQQCINSIAAEFPTEIHCNFLSFQSQSENRTDFPQLKFIR